MQILITDLTRMTQGHVCVAGIDLDTGRRVRPVTTQRLPARLMSSHGGVFDARRVIDLGKSTSGGIPPEIEDVFFDPAGARHVTTHIGTAFFERLRAAACDGLDAFGPQLLPIGRNGLGTDENHGLCSLVIARATTRFTLYLSHRNTLRARWPDGLDLSVTDVRLYAEDFETPDRTKIAWLERRLAESDEVYLCYGLSRPFRRSTDDRARHWLQLNNIHLSAAPDWQLRWPRERYAV